MIGTPYEMRNNETYGDMAAWMAANAPDNEADIRRLKRNLRLAREAELTPRQRQMLHMRFEDGMNMSDIARALGVNKSTVSRTIARARVRLRRCLRYTI